MTERIMVLGIGNPLVGDEGVGVRIAEALTQRYVFPPQVEVMDAGTMGMGMLGILKRSDYVIVADAVDGTGEEPGAVVMMSADEIAPATVLHSAHDMRLANVLEAAKLIGTAPDTDVVGVQIGEMKVGRLDLTPPVEAAVPRAVEAILGLLAVRGVRPIARD